MCDISQASSYSMTNDFKLQQQVNLKCHNSKSEEERKHIVSYFENV